MTAATEPPDHNRKEPQEPLIKNKGSMMVVLFLGAGASAPFGYPVMRDLSSKLLKEIRDKEGDLLHHFSVLSGKAGKEFDAETVLQDIEVFKAIYNRGLNKTFTEGVPGFSYCRIEGKRGPSNVSLDDFYKLCLELERIVRWSLFDIYQFDPKLSSKFPLYDVLFSFLGSQKEVRVYTTNYDKVIENYCLGPGKKYEIRDGFTHNSDLQRYLWNPIESFESSSPSRKTIIKLFKLHGSLDWKEGPYGIERGSHEVRLGPAPVKDLLIYPGSKDPPEDDPFRTLYESFEKQMEEPEPCLVIGFSFRDYYLNRFFRDFIKRTNGQLLVMSSNSAETIRRHLLQAKMDELNSYVEKSRVVPIPCHFGESEWMTNLSEALRKTGWVPPANR